MELSFFLVPSFIAMMYVGVVSGETHKLKKELALNKPLECQGVIIDRYEIKDDFIVTGNKAYAISWPECKKIELRIVENQKNK